MDESVFLNFPNLWAKQTRRGCIQELCGCEAETEFRIATKENPHQDIFYAIEHSSCCMRTFCPTIRPFDMTVSLGGQRGGQELLKIHRDVKCAPGPCKCCCYQEVDVSSSASSKQLGVVREDFYCCIPTYKVMTPEGNTQYKIHQPTCVGGMCVDIFAEGVCNCRIPFYAFEPGAKGEKGEEKGSIVKVWSGLSKELFTDADNFEVDFPIGSDAATRSRFFAALFLLNQLYFERSRQQ